MIDELIAALAAKGDMTALGIAVTYERRLVPVLILLKILHSTSTQRWPYRGNGPKSSSSDSVHSTGYWTQANAFNQAQADERRRTEVRRQWMNKAQQELKQRNKEQ